MKTAAVRACRNATPEAAISRTTSNVPPSTSTPGLEAWYAMELDLQALTIVLDSRAVP